MLPKTLGTAFAESKSIHIVVPNAIGTLIAVNPLSWWQFKKLTRH